MPLAVFPNVALTAVSAVVPADAVSLEDELEYYDGSLERARRLSEVSGLSTRRLAPEGVTASDLCIRAAEQLLEARPDARDGIGALIFVSHSPDYMLPASAALQQHALGLAADCATMDMNVGCAGFVKGLWVASGLIQSRACSKVLLLVGDTPNRFLNPANRVTSPVFGDAGTAALLERSGNSPPMSFLLGSDGGRYEALVVPGGGSRIPLRREDGPDAEVNRTVADARGNPWTLGGYCQIWMDGMGIYTFAMSVVPRHIKRHLELAGRSVQDLDALLLHQANKVIIEGIAKKTGMAPDRVPYETLPRYGNLGSSSIPALICEHYAPTGEGRDAPRGNVMLCAFGAGLAWGSCLLSLEHTVILPVHDYTPPDDLPTREERIAYWHGKFSGNR